MTILDTFRGRPRNHRDDGTWETTRKQGPFRRLTLRRTDGRVYLDRWGIGSDRLGAIMLHRMQAPDPGVDLHDHPWFFVSIVLRGGYFELRASTREAADMAREAAAGLRSRNGHRVARYPFTVKTMRLDECHTITDLIAGDCWTLVIRGPRRRRWGFYLADGWMAEADYDATVRAHRRDLWSDQNEEARPW